MMMCVWAYLETSNFLSSVERFGALVCWEHRLEVADGLEYDRDKKNWSALL